MRPQIDFSLTPVFRRFLRELANTEGAQIASLVQGVLIDFHPIWKRLWEIQQNTGFDLTRDSWPWWEYFGWWPTVTTGQIRSTPPDPEYCPETWKRLVEINKKEVKEPFLVKISVRSTRPGDPDLRTLRALAARQPFFCIVEERPIARVATSVDGGGEITATLSGTLGGFLKDQNGTVYGVTCAHVAQKDKLSVDVHDVSGSTLTKAGTVAHTSYGKLTPLGTKQLCNRVTTSEMEEQDAEENASSLGAAVDIALVTLNPPHSGLSTVKRIGTVDTIFNSSQFGSGSAVELRGAVSGYHSGYIGAYAVVYKVLFPNNKLYCFDHMFEVKTPTRFAGITPPALASKAVSGDSGAWICADNGTGNGNKAYCGTLVAVDGVDAYACFAEAACRWAKASHGLDLQAL